MILRQCKFASYDGAFGLCSIPPTKYGCDIPIVEGIRVLRTVQYVRNTSGPMMMMKGQWHAVRESLPIEQCS